jgi:hypothetical protein
MLSFFFPFTFITVLKMFLNTFFSMCMTPKLWQRRLFFNKKAPRNSSLYPIMGQIKTRKLLFTLLKIKLNVTVLWHHIIQLFTWKKRWCSIPFNCANKKSFLVLSELVIRWQEPLMALKKDILSSFVNVNALLFFIQNRHASFSCMLYPETIL